MTISLLQASEYWVRDSLQLKKKERVIIDGGMLAIIELFHACLFLLCII